MNALRYTLLILHFVGLAAILGPFLDQLRSDAKRISMTMVWGARAQLITGLGLVGVAMAGDYELDHVKIAVKFAVALAIAGLAEVGRNKKAPQTFWLLIGLLTIVNIIVAVVWR
ncbi:hypothetical protein [Demequina activiva]|uniref:Uncharacterized protein n=1 Tax=Demequina activiva TaxID=1582364 RepID=A0A919UJU9_9MICO|nr:hypothetical protein [Demequina activiva]GIG54701.1 hypothetical protein Dac01nite_14530 [Demequina activiva]